MMIVKYPIFLLLSIWNPFPRKWKPRWPDGRPVLDIRSRRIDREKTEAEIKRRLENGEELRQCFKIKSKSSLSLSGKSV